MATLDGGGVVVPYPDDELDMEATDQRRSLSAADADPVSVFAVSELSGTSRLALILSVTLTPRSRLGCSLCARFSNTEKERGAG